MDLVREDRTNLYNPLHPDTLSDPFSIYNKIRKVETVFWHEDLFAWVLLSHDDCSRVLRDSVCFTRDRRKLGRPVRADSMNIQSFDYPDQIFLREALLNAIRRVDLIGICENSLNILSNALTSFPKGHSFDFMSEVAAPTATHFACSLVGLKTLPPNYYHSLFLRLTRSMDSVLDHELYLKGIEATKELTDLIDDAYDDPISGSIIDQLGALPAKAEISNPILRNTVSATFNAAYSTAYSSMGSILALALNDRDLSKRIVDTGNVRVGVNELLRYTSPAQSTRRYATQDLTIGNSQIRENDPILTVMAAANRDPNVFEYPDKLILTRTPNPHLGFGLGSHFCAGAQPALLFLEAFIHSLAEWENSVELVESPSWLNTFTLRCIDKLNIVQITDQ